MNAVLAPKPDLPVARRKSSAVSTVMGAFESETAAVFVRTAPVRQHLILYALVAILALSLALSAIIKLDRVVTSVGLVVPTAGALYVSPFDTGIVKQINVKEGDVVRKGQTLATLDPTFAHADLVQLQQKLASDEAAVARARCRSLRTTVQVCKERPGAGAPGRHLAEAAGGIQVEPR